MQTTDWIQGNIRCINLYVMLVMILLSISLSLLGYLELTRVENNVNREYHGTLLTGNGLGKKF